MHRTIRIIGILLSGGLISSLFLTSEALSQSNFDCRRPRSEAIATICRDPQLANRDADVARAYRSALENSADPQRVRDAQNAWGYQIESCGPDRQCLAGALEDGLANINRMTVKSSEVAETSAVERETPIMPKGPFTPTTQALPQTESAETTIDSGYQREDSATVTQDTSYGALERGSV